MDDERQTRLRMSRCKVIRQKMPLRAPNESQVSAQHAGRSPFLLAWVRTLRVGNAHTRVTEYTSGQVNECSVVHELGCREREREREGPRRGRRGQNKNKKTKTCFLGPRTPGALSRTSSFLLRVVDPPGLLSQPQPPSPPPTPHPCLPQERIPTHHYVAPTNSV
jgi:hypothetical protein